jgi:hypothetical protein
VTALVSVTDMVVALPPLAKLFACWATDHAISQCTRPLCAPVVETEMTLSSRADDQRAARERRRDVRRDRLLCDLSKLTGARACCSDTSVEDGTAGACSC